MSKEIDRRQVLHNVRVRKALKKDGSWINRSKDDDTTLEGGDKPAPLRRKSYVLSTARIFESTDPSQSSSPQKAESIPSDSDSANQKNGEINPAPKDAQPQGSTVEATGDATLAPQSTTEEVIQDSTTAPETAVAEIKEENANLSLDESNVEPSAEPAEVSADAHTEQDIQQVSSANENSEAASSPGLSEQTPANAAAGHEDGRADEPTDPSATDPNETKVSGDADVESHDSEVAAVGGTAETPATPVVEVTLQEESLVNSEEASATSLEDAGIEISAQPTGESLDNFPTQQAEEDVVVASTEVIAESLSETSDVTNAASGQDASLQESEPSLPDILVETMHQSHSQPAAQIPTDVSCDACPPVQDIKQNVETVAEFEVEESSEITLPETSPVFDNAAAEEEVAPENSAQPGPGPLPESDGHPTAEATINGSNELSSSEQGTTETVEAVAEVEETPEAPAADNAAPEEQVALESNAQVPEPLPESDDHPTAEATINGNNELSPSEVNTKEIVETVAEVEETPEAPAADDPAPEEQVAPENSAQVPEPLPKSDDHPTTESTLNGNNELSPSEVNTKEIVETVAEVEETPEAPAADDPAPEEEVVPENSAQVPDPLPESVDHPTAETTTKGSHELSPSEQSTEEIVEVTAGVEVESLPDIPAADEADEATPADEAAPLTSVQPVPDNLSESPAAEAPVRSAECEVESARLAEPETASRTEEVVECEAQSEDNAEQSVEPTPEDAADHMPELNVEDAVKPVPAAHAEAVSDHLVDRVIDLTDALDVEAPSAEAVPEAVEDPEQSVPEEPGLKEQADNTNISEISQKPAEEHNSPETLNVSSAGRATCSFCKQVVDGNVKISLGDSLIISHEECLKCGICAKALGDLLTNMYLHENLIQCGDCFIKTLKF
ncbi:cell surface glycoprotein 1 [Cololabis saira]|uniref:cell surface glycoprotein 1 n=1 Tax=Cololabis saira TaxID=129043 RepID=UPI002AD403E7|nr:cell surface glycoprotein 1 [Cololabis saira]